MFSTENREMETMLERQGQDMAKLTDTLNRSTHERSTMKQQWQRAMSELVRCCCCGCYRCS